MPTTYTACVHCGATLSRPASQHIGLCGGCRGSRGWTVCQGCSESSISPKGDPCPICTPAPTTTSPMIHMGPCMGGCGNRLGTNKAEAYTGLCMQCRSNRGWKHCGGCGNYTVAPNGASCPVCHPTTSTVSVAGPTAPTTQTSTPKYPFKVKCVDAGDNRLLKTGVVYTAVGEREDGEYYILQEFPDKSFLQRRFEVVEEGTRVPIPIPTVDISDWKVWRDFGKPAGVCACGIQSSMCDYHRK